MTVLARYSRLSVFSYLMTAFALVVLVLAQSTAQAATAREIDASVQVALENFSREVSGGQEFLNSAKGILVMPKVYKAGIGFGGEYGTGALRIGGKNVNYYKMMAGSWGLQLGAQKKTVILVFMEQQALNKFRNSSGWQAGVDASVALIKIGAGGSIDTNTVKSPVVGFVLGQKGLMYDLSLEGTKFSKIYPKP